MTKKEEHRKSARSKLVRAKGQLDGIIRMIDEERYCIDISTQLLAVMGLVKSANLEVLKGHMKSCVKDSIESSEDGGDEIIDEMIDTIGKYLK